MLCVRAAERKSTATPWSPGWRPGGSEELLESTKRGSLLGSIEGGTKMAAARQGRWYSLLDHFPNPCRS